MANDTPIVIALRAVLADSYRLYFKTHAFHWNVTGPHFKSLHDLFGVQYTELWMALDVIAERIRSLGAFAPTNSVQIVAYATIKEADDIPSAAQMVKILAADNRALVATLYKAIAVAAEDEGTLDLLVPRVALHEKAAWMLEASA